MTLSTGSDDHRAEVERLRTLATAHAEWRAETLREVRRLREGIARAYGAAQEMAHDDHQALVCVLEVLEPLVRKDVD